MFVSTDFRLEPAIISSLVLKKCGRRLDFRRPPFLARSSYAGLSLSKYPFSFLGFVFRKTSRECAHHMLNVR